MTHEDKQELRDLLSDKLDPIIKRLEEHHESLFARDAIRDQTQANTEFRKTTIWHLRTLWGAVVAALITLFVNR